MAVEAGKDSHSALVDHTDLAGMGHPAMVVGLVEDLVVAVASDAVVDPVLEGLAAVEDLDLPDLEQP